MTSDLLPLGFQRLYDAGNMLATGIRVHLDNWPSIGAMARRGINLPDEVKTRIEELRDQAHRWFNEITIQVLPQTTFERSYANVLLRRINAAINAERFYEEYQGDWYVPGESGIVSHNIVVDVSPNEAKEEADEVINQALRLIRTAMTSQTTSLAERQIIGHVANSAFILMWMDEKHPELVDVHQAVKEVFAEFGIEALRADEIQHQDRITDLILDKIAQSEFLFADMTGERPNVYYEVGYAHALGKRPILYRRKGTPLHFDLSIHNVPEYENVTQLRSLLRERLEAITGRVLTE